jgi:hypothetical protein
MREWGRFLRNTPCLSLLVVQLGGVVLYIAMVVTRLVSLRAERRRV